MFDTKTIINASGNTSIIVPGVSVPSGTDTTIFNNGSSVATVNPWGITKNN